MSLEKAIEANTLALQKLLEALTKAAGLTGCADVDALPDRVVNTQPAEKVVKPAEKVADTGDKQWTYDELRTDFLALVKANKPAALAILASFNVATLTELKDKETFYPAIAAKIVEASNG